MDSHRDTFEPGPPPGSGSPPNRIRLALVWLSALIVTLLVVLIVVLLVGDDDTSVAADTSSTEAPSTSAPVTITVAPAPPATPAPPAPPATAAPPATPATTEPSEATEPPEEEEVESPEETYVFPEFVLPVFPSIADHRCPEPDPNAPLSDWPSKITDIEFADFDGYTRITFIGDGQVAPACRVHYVEGEELALVTTWYPVDVFDPFAADIFDAGGYLNVGLGSVNWVESEGTGGGSGEWSFRIKLNNPSRPFWVSALSGPSRLVIDIVD